MTVSTTSRSQTYAGGQQTLTFNFRTLVSNPEYIAVNVISSGTTTALVYNVGYTVAVNSTGVGGTVTVSPSYGTNYTYVVYRQTGLTQSSAFSDYNAFPSSTVENDFDKLTMINQENADNANRALTLPIGSSTSISTTLPVPVASYLLGWDATATFIQNTQGIAGPSGSTGATGPAGGINNVKVVQFIYNIASTSGTQTISNVGFTPKAVIFIGALTTTSTPASMSVGLDDGATPYSIVTIPSGSTTSSDTSNNSIVIATTAIASNSAQGKVTAFNSSGFVITWVKTGSPTGSAAMAALCIG